ncbi:putative zinc-binding metallopeptidase [candidate division FCPU426 bacterium]|nr:putative zinc-binding metallopeptidase [candidate division FCPU426 bacterium]
MTDTKNRAPMTTATIPAWADWPDDKVLELRLCDLKLDIRSTYLETCIQSLYRELQERGLHFQPLCYLGDEWFSPDSSPSIAIPFYLAHPRLKQLEKKFMLEVEGDSESECMKLLRHETGHALCHAFGLPRRRLWQAVFGSPKKEFRDFYHYQPYSKSFVRHLENWYAQSHPEEDFAETFAVWLTPALNWKKQYEGWPAYKKLLYTDKLMRELKGKTPPRFKIEKPFAISRLKMRLKTHYEKRRKFYAEDDPALFDSDLKRIFPSLDAEGQRSVPASTFLLRQRTLLLAVIPHWTHERKFTVNRLLRKLAARCAELKLPAPKDEDQARAEVIAYLTALVSNYLFTGKFKGHL